MSRYADEGTIAHALAAMALEEGRPASAYINRIIQAEDYEHASLSPSSADRWMLCSGSWALEAQTPFVPRKFEAAVTREMAEGVQVYLDNVRQYIGEHPFSVEHPVPIGHLTGEEGATGTADVVVLAGDELQVHDLKFGRGVEVSAHENRQLRIYALGLIEEYALVHEFKRVRLVIHQPRINSKPDEWDCSIEDLLVFADHVNASAELARYAKQHLEVWKDEPGTSHLNPGEKQCRFCEAKARCPALTKHVSEAVLGELGDLAAPEAPKLVQEATAKHVKLLPNEELGRLLAIVPLVDAWCSAVSAQAELELLAGRSVPGFKVVQGRRGNRAWSDPAAAEKLLKDTFRLKVEEMYDLSLISPTTAEKRSKDGVIGPRQWAKVQDLITQSDGKPTVVPESDKRPALEIKPIEDELGGDLSEEEYDLV